jgi:hypothetical protein
VAVLEDGETALFEETCESFRLPSEEFGFEALADECSAFAALHSSRCEECVIGSLMARVSALEEQKRFCKQESEVVHPFLDKLTLLEGEIDRLSDVCGRLEQHFEAEQAYRRVFDRQGQEVTRAFGLSLLKRAADLGNSDGQYRYGRCLVCADGCEKDESRGTAKFIR